MAKQRFTDITTYTSGYKKQGADTKLQYNLIPAECLEELAIILTYGANKYEPHNWKKCTNMDFYWDSLFRHLQQYRLGESVDKESGFNHLSHALCNLMFLVYFERKDNDGTATTSKDNKILRRQRCVRGKNNNNK